jgi:hypothetical protein
MSADPSVAGDASVTTEGNVHRNMLYTSEAGKLSTLRVQTVSFGGALHENNQTVIPPYDADMHRKHPCIDPNMLLGKCSDALPAEMKLSMRATACWQERTDLLKCRAKNKRWQAPPDAPWWKVWDR